MVTRPARTVLVAATAAALLAGCSGGAAPTSTGRSPTATSHATTPAPLPEATLTPAPATASPTPSPSLPVGPVPQGFVPNSATFVSLRDAWVLGTAPCGEVQRCLVLLRTADGGRTWRSVPTPPDHYPVDYPGGGVRAVRFADLQNGWVFRPDLWATHDGGAHWSRPALGETRADVYVMSLETSAGFVHATVVGDGEAVTIESSPVGRDAWQRSPTTVELGAGPVADPQLILHGSTGWIIEVNRTVSGGARLEHGQWSPWGPPCLDRNGPAVLAASTESDLVAVCDEGVWGPPSPPATRAYVSTDGGSTFQLRAGQVPPFIAAIASPRPGVAFMDNTATFDGGRTWKTILPAVCCITEIGFTSDTQGVMISNDGQPSPTGGMLMTFDGGHMWSEVVFRSA